MESIRLKNYRCFKDTGNIAIKPINLFVGANSSGKSSVLKFFPLLKQTMDVRLNGVFLWLGKYVDFKDFQNTVLQGEKCIEVEYTIKKLNIISRTNNDRGRLNDVHVHFSIVGKNEHFDRLRDLSIFFDNTIVEITFNEDNYANIKTGEEDSSKIEGLKIRYSQTNSIFPVFFFSYKKAIESLISSMYPSIYMQKMKNIGGKIDERFNRAGNPRIFERFPKTYTDFKKGILGICKRDGIENFDENIIKSLYSKALIYNIETLIDSLNYDALQFSSNLVYVKPLRATIERYYRFQNLDVDEIDSDGTNLPMYLYNLPKERLDQFKKWLSDVFNFDIEINPLEGHIELLISEKGKTFRNPVDLGFGYTQMLPILAIVWKAMFIDTFVPEPYKKRNNEHIVVIEQPELHLHPRFQAVFARMLATAIKFNKDKGNDVRFIIETHSETILNVLGEEVEKGSVDNDDIGVYLFEQDKYGISTVRTSSYTKEGYLESWPKNFMEYAD